jgi:alkylhydroperoxidase/carboxymuconolactone decarboxylase family protein YurZ
MTGKTGISDSVQTFLTQAPDEAKAWMEAVRRLGEVSRLDPKTRALCYLSALAAARMSSGVPFHAARAAEAGATRQEIIAAVLVGLPAVGNVVVESLPAALQALEG